MCQFVIDKNQRTSDFNRVWATSPSCGYNWKHYVKVSGVYLLIDNIGQTSDTRFEFAETAGKYILSLAIGGVEVVNAEDEFK